MKAASWPTLRWAPLALAYASLFALGMSDNARGALFPELLVDLRLGDAAGSLLFAITSAGVIVGSLASRRALDRLGARALLQLSLLTMGAGLLALAAAEGLPSLLATSTLFGVGLGGVALAQNMMVEQSAPPELRRRAFAGLHAMYALSSLLAPLAVAAVYRAGGSWRSGLACLAPVSLLVLAAGWAVRPLPTRPRRAAPGASASPGAEAPLGLGPWLIAFATGGAVVAELLLSTRLPLLLQREGLGPEPAKLYLSAFFACLLGGRLLVTLVPLRLGNRALLTISASGALALFVAGLGYEPRLLPAVALFLAPFFPVATDLLAEEHREQLDRGISLTMACVSSLLIPAHIGVGALSEVVGLRRALAIGPAALLLTLTLIAWSARRAARRRG